MFLLALQFVNSNINRSIESTVPPKGKITFDDLYYALDLSLSRAESRFERGGEGMGGGKEQKWEKRKSFFC